MKQRRLLQPGEFTRGQLAQRLGLSEHQLKQLDGRGVLKAARFDQHGRALYNEETVHAVRGALNSKESPYTAEECHKVFRLLSAAEKAASDPRAEPDYAEMVVEAGVHYLTFKAILNDYQALKRRVTLFRLDLLQIADVLPELADVESAGDFVAKTHVAVKNLALCPSCVERPRGLCAGCSANVKTQLERRRHGPSTMDDLPLHEPEPRNADPEDEPHEEPSASHVSSESDLEPDASSSEELAESKAQRAKTEDVPAPAPPRGRRRSRFVSGSSPPLEGETAGPPDGGDGVDGKP